jgi:hypothetical protein
MLGSALTIAQRHSRTVDFASAVPAGAILELRGQGHGATASLTARFETAAGRGGAERVGLIRKQQAS